VIKLIVGFDCRESVVYHTFCQSVLEKTSQPIAFVPLVDNALAKIKPNQTDGSNSFTYSRFLTPYLMDFKGWAIYADGDMICQEDIADLWKLRDETKAVMAVKHDYKTKSATKYFDNKNTDYPRKNWSSLVLWNCSHQKNRVLTPEFVNKSTGAKLHRFTWLADEDIGELDISWNWLVEEYPNNANAKILHYTLGSPCFKKYKTIDSCEAWNNCFSRMTAGLQ
jgi:lipopolysaccharide biosynthesis glycosyltransferase